MGINFLIALVTLAVLVVSMLAYLDNDDDPGGPA